MALKGNIHTLSKLAGPEEQKKQIFKDLGDLAQYDILDDQVLVATYVESNVLSRVRDPSGKMIELIGTENRAGESRFQGKVGLVVKMGPTAFRYHNNGQPYEGKKPEAGDWVVSAPSAAKEIGLRDANSNGEWVMCRAVHWSQITMRVSDPRVVH